MLPYLCMCGNLSSLYLLIPWNLSLHVQYIPRNMHTVFALLCFVVVIHWLIFPYPSGLLHWHCGNLTIAPVPAKQPWWIWIKTSCKFIMNDCITTTKQSTTKLCAYFLRYTVMVLWHQQVQCWLHYYIYAFCRLLKVSTCCRSGSWFNIKMISDQYRKSCCGNKMISRPSYLHKGISFTGKTTSLYWIRAQMSLVKITNKMSWEVMAHWGITSSIYIQYLYSFDTITYLCTPAFFCQHHSLSSPCPFPEEATFYLSYNVLGLPWHATDGTTTGVAMSWWNHFIVTSSFVEKCANHRFNSHLQIYNIFFQIILIFIQIFSWKWC